MINSMEKFGVKQRCLEGTKTITDLLFLNLRYSKDENFYIYEDDYKFLGIVNAALLLEKNYTSEQGKNILLKDICIQTPSVIQWTDGDDLPALLDKTFRNFPVDETVIVSKETGTIVGIINSNDFYNEILSIQADSEKDFLCYRKLSHRYVRKQNGLNAFAYNVNSQHGEDGILEAIFNKIGTTSKYAIEFGGWDGIYLSNIRNLIVEKGFSGLFIEGEADRAENLLNNYKDYPNVACVSAFVGFRGENTLDNILSRNNAPKDIDLLSIDIDGYDYHVWEAFQNYKPRIVIIEYNPSIPNDIMFINPRDEGTFNGSSAAALVELGRKKGYSLIAVTQTNLIFVVDEEFDKFEIWDNSLEALRTHDRLGDGKYFQTYDGTIFFTGFNHYIWNTSKSFKDGPNRYVFTDV